MSALNCKQESESQIKFSLRVSVPAEDLDPLYKHLHHTKALLLLERARLTFLEKIGFSSQTLIAKDLFPVIARIDVRYRREIGAGEFLVTCEECHVERVLLRIKQRILDSEGRVLVQATVDSVLMSGKSKSAVVPGDDFVRAFNAF